MGERHDARVVIVGAGFSGLGMAIQLKKMGIDDLVILEQADEVGGTWRDNVYPGCTCDIPSHLYSFSFAQNSEWTRSFPSQAEILDYLRRLVDQYDLRRHIRFGVEVTGMRWDGDAYAWHVATRSGDEFVGQFAVSALGVLHIPHVPALPGLDGFQGTVFHSARWDQDFEPRGKRVAVIGTGASAVQFVPTIAADVARLHLFQRTPPWVLPKRDFSVPRWVRTVFRRLPVTQRLYRAALYWKLESRALAFNGRTWLLTAGERNATAHVERHVADPRARRALLPSYRLGCKRVLLSNDFYPALNRRDVELVTAGITEVRAQGVVTADGVERPVDTIIFATGFQVAGGFHHLDVVGEDGRGLAAEWAARGVRTYLGTTVSGYPNLFLLLGPNTGLGHNSVVFMIESQIRYIADAIKLADTHHARALDVRASVQARFYEEIQGELRQTVWARGGCASWYLDAAGNNGTMWPGFSWRYWLRTRRVNPADYQLIGARRPGAKALAASAAPVSA